MLYPLFFDVRDIDNEQYRFYINQFYMHSQNSVQFKDYADLKFALKKIYNLNRAADIDLSV